MTKNNDSDTGYDTKTNTHGQTLLEPQSGFVDIVWHRNFGQ